MRKENFWITKRDEDGVVIQEAMPKRDVAWIWRDSYDTEFGVLQYIIKVFRRHR